MSSGDRDRDAVPAFPLGILCPFSGLFHGMLRWEGPSGSSHSMGREFRAALWFLTENSWFSKEGKLRDCVFPVGWIQRHSRAQPFPALRGETWEFSCDVD